MDALLRDPTPRLTRSVEDYLKAIYHLSNQVGLAATSDIAAMLAAAGRHTGFRAAALPGGAGPHPGRTAHGERASAVQRADHDRAGAVGRPKGRGTGVGAAPVVPRGAGGRVWRGRSLSPRRGGGFRASLPASPRRTAPFRSTPPTGGAGRSRSRARAIWSPWGTWIRATGPPTWRGGRRSATRC